MALLQKIAKFLDRRFSVSVPANAFWRFMARHGQIPLAIIAVLALLWLDFSSFPSAHFSLFSLLFLPFVVVNLKENKDTVTFSVGIFGSIVFGVTLFEVIVHAIYHTL